jgi:hypothetical protein
MKPTKNIKLYDFLIMSKCDYDTFDTEYDGIITCVCIEDEPEDYYEKFYHEMCKKVEIVRVINKCLVVNWSNLIERNLEKFKEFTNEYWKYKYEDDNEEFIYQWINEIQAYFAGYVGEDFYETLYKFAETLN